MTLAGVVLSSVVGRRAEIEKGILRLDGGVWLYLLWLGLIFVLIACLGFLTDLAAGKRSTEQEGRPPFELIYAFRRTVVAEENFEPRVSLWLEAPPKATQPTAPPAIDSRVAPPSAFLGLLSTVGAPEQAPPGERIRALIRYDVQLWNTGEKPLQPLPIAVKLAPFRYGAETIIGDPSAYPPTGAEFKATRESDTMIRANCDLFNPREFLHLSFYTRRSGFQRTGEESTIRLAARAPELPQPTECDWDEANTMPRRPLRREIECRPRSAVLLAAGKLLASLGGFLNRMGLSIGYKCVVRR